MKKRGREVLDGGFPLQCNGVKTVFKKKKTPLENSVYFLGGPQGGVWDFFSSFFVIPHI